MTAAYTALKERWYLLPTLSGALFILTFHPFNLWPLGFVALAPLGWFAGGFGHSRRTVFFGGFITGGMFSFFLSYYTIAQFHWLPETYLFVWAVHALVLPIVALGGGLCGASLLIYAALRGRSLLLNAVLAAAVYTLSELVSSFVFFGYNVGLLAYAAVPVTPLLGFASLGGAHFVSFVVMLTSGFLAEALMAGYVPWRALATVALCAAVVFVPNYLYLHRPSPPGRAMTVSVLQMGTREKVSYGFARNGQFFWAEASALALAASTTPDLLIYPFSPVEGALYDGPAPAFDKPVLAAHLSSLARFAQGLMPASTTLMTWSDVYTDKTFYDEYEFWQGGALVSAYQKRDIFPFINYTPQWAQKLGFYSTSYDISSGPPDNRPSLWGVPLGALMCSELHDTALARREARQTPLIIAVGSDSVFVDDVVGAFNLKEAQLRAAENDIPVVRGNILGPSAIIDRFGKPVAFAPAGEEAVLSARVPLTPPRPTLFNRYGDLPLVVMLGGILAAAYKYKKRG